MCVSVCVCVEEEARTSIGHPRVVGGGAPSHPMSFLASTAALRKGLTTHTTPTHPRAGLAYLNEEPPASTGHPLRQG